MQENFVPTSASSQRLVAACCGCARLSRRLRSRSIALPSRRPACVVMSLPVSLESLNQRSKAVSGICASFCHRDESLFVIPAGRSRFAVASCDCEDLLSPPPVWLMWKWSHRPMALSSVNRASCSSRIAFRLARWSTTRGATACSAAAAQARRSRRSLGVLSSARVAVNALTRASVSRRAASANRTNSCSFNRSLGRVSAGNI
jgi:hypothetical protein